MLDYSYPKSHRLLKPSQFKKVFDNAIFKVHQPYLMLFIAKNDQGHARLGMAITKKKLPTAIGRNRLKRLIRERFRSRLKELPAVDIIFTVKKPINTMTNKQLTTEINNLLNKMIVKLN